MFVSKKRYWKDLQEVEQNERKLKVRLHEMEMLCESQKKEIDVFRSQDWAKEWEKYYNKRSAYLHLRDFADPYSKSMEALVQRDTLQQLRLNCWNQSASPHNVYSNSQSMLSRILL